MPATSWPAPAIEEAITCSCATVPPGLQQKRTRPSRSRLVLVPWPPALPGGCTTPRERQGNQVHRIRIACDQLASSRHRGGVLLQLRDRSPGPAAEAHQTIQITTCPDTVATGTAGRLYHAQGTPGQPGAPDPHCRRPAGQLPPSRRRSPAAARPFPRASSRSAPDHPDHDLSWYRGHRHCRAAVPRPGNARATRCTGSALPATSWPAPAIEAACSCSCATVPPGLQQKRTRPSRSRLVLVPWPPALPGGCTTPRERQGNQVHRICIAG